MSPPHRQAGSIETETERQHESPVRREGFTLIELLVVIAIIAILASSPPGRSSTSSATPPN